jgi:hypothetical protein
MEIVLGGDARSASGASRSDPSHIDWSRLDAEIPTVEVLVQILERASEALERLRTAYPRREHSAAHGHLRSALCYERKLLAERSERQAVFGEALRKIEAGEKASQERVGSPC